METFYWRLYWRLSLSLSLYWKRWYANTLSSRCQPLSGVNGFRVRTVPVTLCALDFFSVCSDPAPCDSRKSSIRLPDDQTECRLMIRRSGVRALLPCRRQIWTAVAVSATEVGHSADRRCTRCAHIHCQSKVPGNWTKLDENTPKIQTHI